MRKIAVFGVVFVALALAVCLVSCSSSSSPSAVISFSVNGEIVRSQVVTESSGLDVSAPDLTDGVFMGWFTDPACTVPFSFHDYILSGSFEDITVYALVSHDDAEDADQGIEEDPCEHDLRYFAAKPSTCSERGNLEYWYCSVCGHYYADETCTAYISPFLDRLGHKPEFVAAKSATCTESGTREHWHCSLCGLAFADENCTVVSEIPYIEKFGHVLVYFPEEPSSCTAAGHLEYWSCSVCNDSFSSVGAAEAVSPESLRTELLPHSYTATEILESPSETASGSARLVCSCGGTALLTLPALSSDDYTVVSVPSTCTEHGSDAYTLAGAYPVRIVRERELSPHTPGDVEGKTDPTCIRDGSSGFVLCTQCGVVLSPSKPVPASGHDWQKTVYPSTCTEQGYAVSSCSVCKETKRGSLPLEDHPLVFVPETKSSCIAAGVASHYVCSACGALFTEDKTPCSEQDLALPLSPHSPDSAGVCSVCGHCELPGALFEQNSSGGVTFTGFEDGYSYPDARLVIPSSFNGIPVTAIAENAFSENVKNVTSLVLPDSLLSVPEGALSVFLDHKKIESLTLPFVGTSKDEGCALIKLFDKDANSNASLPSSLTSVTVTDCSSVCDNAFASAFRLTEIRINEGCSEIGSRAFSACSALENLYLPSTLQTIADDAFSRSFSSADDPKILFAGSGSLWSSVAENCAMPEVTVICKE